MAGKDESGNNVDAYIKGGSINSTLKNRGSKMEHRRNERKKGKNNAVSKNYRCGIEG